MYSLLTFSSPPLLLLFAVMFSLLSFSFFFFFNDTATTEIYTLSLHDALPISKDFFMLTSSPMDVACRPKLHEQVIVFRDRKSTRLNSSHGYISYAVFCLKKKKKKNKLHRP